MAKTTILVVGAVTPVAIVPTQPFTNLILLYENSGAADAAIVFSAPLSGSPQANRPAGALLQIPVPSGIAQSQAPLGFILAASGSMNIAQEEYP